MTLSRTEIRAVQAKRRKRKENKEMAKNIKLLTESTNIDEAYQTLIQMVPHGGKYSCQQRVDALFGYITTASDGKTAKMIGLDVEVIKSWKKEKWWKPALVKIKEFKQEELDERYTAILERTLTELEDRLDNGDEVLTKDGDVRRKKIGAKDLMLINAIGFDKRAAMRGKPSSVSEKIITIDDRNQLLADQFRKLASGNSEKVIEAEVIIEGNGKAGNGDKGD